MGEHLYTIDENGVFLRIEFIAIVPSAVACADVTEPYVFGAVGDFKLDCKAIVCKESTISLPTQLHDVASVEQRHGMLFQWLVAPFVLSGIGEKV